MTQNYIERYWRDATPADAIKEPPMVARFRQDAQSLWHFGCNQKLTGVDRDDDGTVIRWFSNKTSISFGHCQVYDAPDPGEGYELIDITKATKQKGDEFFSFKKGWKPAHSDEFFSSHFYRRRITPTVTYVPFTWEDREQLRGRWIGSNDGRCERSINAMHNDNGIFYLRLINAESLCTDWHFLDTGEPVGKKVTQ